MQYLSTLFVLCLLFLGSNSLFAQAGNCFDSYLSPFCSGIAQYPANFDGTGAGSGPQAPAGPNYDCLGTQGNPTYFSVTIEQTGSINFTLDNTANVDIDFILWGPFSSIGAAQAACDSIGQGGQWGDVDTCSYSGITAEPVSISNAVAGEIYILMVTNFANVATNIFSTANTGTGAIACPCDIPYTVDTMSTANGNQGFLIDTINGLNQYLVCPNMTLGIQLEAKSALNDTLNLYGPFTTVNTVFNNNSVFAFNPNAPAFYDSLTIFTLVTPDNSNIGVNNFSIGLQNTLYTGGLTDSTCFDLLDFQVIVPGVQVSDRMVCSGDSFQVLVDSIPTTSLGASAYAWSQISGPSINFSSTTARQPIISIPITASNSSNDSTVIIVDYNYGGLCTMRDTMVLHYPNQSINALATDTTCIGLPTTLMVNMQDTLNPAICDDYVVTSIPNNPLPNTGTLVNTFTATATFPATDEGISAALPIGFDFGFYCTTYNQFYIHTNGFITFDSITGTPGLLSGNSMPTAGLPNNIIALSWEDLDVANGGTINYYVQGTAPNRQLVVSFNAIQNWSGGNSMTSQAILYEADNSIEIHITNNDFNFSSIGIENGNGTIAHYHASLTQGQSLAPFTNTAYRFTPKTLGPFYNWTPSTTLSAADVYNPVATLQSAGTTNYTVQVQDGACIYQTNTNLVAIPSLNTPQLNCDSSSISSISFSWNPIGLPIGGFYEISLDSGQTWISMGSSLDTTITGLVSDTAYYLLVRGNDGTGGPCSVGPAAMGNCATLNPNCLVNPLINTILTPTHLACNNDTSGCIHAMVSGGSGNPMNFTWSNGLIDVDSICSLGTGTYTLVVTDTFSQGANLVICVDSQSITITEPPVLIGSVDSTLNPFCSGAGDGAVYISTIGGTPTYTFNWSNGATTEDITGVNDGTYTVIITDNKGCTDTTQAILSVPNSVVINLDNSNNNSCDGSPDGSIFISVLGGTGAITYLWNNGATTEDLTGIANNTYMVTVTDQNNCSDTATIILLPTILLVSSDTTIQPLCNGNTGSSTLTVAGGTGTYSFDWGTASTSTSSTALLSGTQTALVTITDTGNGCTIVDSIDLVEPAVQTISLTDTTNIGCNDAPNVGAINLTPSGGTIATAYNFVWDNGASTEDLNSLSAGNYTVTVSDDNGCFDVLTATITAATPIDVNINKLIGQLACDLLPIGSLQANATGGTGITYTWSNNSNTAIAGGLGAGNFIVTASNNEGCSDTASARINAPALPSINPYVSVVGMNSVTVPINSTIVIDAGGSGYNYNWVGLANPTTGNPNIADDQAGSTTANPDPEGRYTYILTASITTNDTICTASDTVWITVETPFKGIPNVFSPNGDAVNDYFAPVTLADSEVSTFRIFNRWSQEIYNGDETHGLGWDGTFNGVEQPAETYLYLIIFQKASDLEPTTIRGKVTLIR